MFCDDINGLLNTIGCEYEPAKWKLFIDSSKRSVKSVLLRNGNLFPSIPKDHLVQIKESYDSMKQVLKKFKYSKHNWKICGDLTIVCMGASRTMRMIHKVSQLSLFVGQPCKKGPLGEIRLAQTN